jgi:hypothetical protein
MVGFQDMKIWLGRKTCPFKTEKIESNKHMTKTDAAKFLGRLGGLVKSPRKTAAVRLNGLKGGRPRKIVPIQDVKN